MAKIKTVDVSTQPHNTKTFVIYKLDVMGDKPLYNAYDSHDEYRGGLHDEMDFVGEVTVDGWYPGSLQEWTQAATKKWQEAE